MKSLKTLIFIQFVLFCQIVAAQSVDSTVTIKVKSGNFIVSGVVADKQSRMFVIEIVSTTIGDKADFGELKVDRSFDSFGFGWRESIKESVDKMNNWKSGVFVFIKPQTETLPDMPHEIWNAEIRLLPDNRTIRPSDFQNKTVVLFFMEYWCGPCLSMADQLQKICTENSLEDLVIIGVSTEPESKESFGKLFEVKKYGYRLGLGDKTMLDKAVKISGLSAIPQAFLVRDGKLDGVFLGSSTSVIDRLKTLIREVSDKKN